MYVKFTGFLNTLSPFEGPYQGHVGDLFSKMLSWPTGSDFRSGGSLHIVGSSNAVYALCLRTEVRASQRMKDASVTVAFVLGCILLLWRRASYE